MKNKFVLAIAMCITLCFAAINRSAAQTATVSKDTTIILEVAGITCGGDLPVICKRVQPEKGITEIKAVSKAAATTKFQVTYNPAIINYQQVVAAVQDAPSCDFPNEKPYKVKKRKN